LALATPDGGAEVIFGETLVLGDDLLVYLVLAFGGAMAVGNIVALVKPPSVPDDNGEVRKAPLARSLVFAVIGAVSALWAIASLIAG
jgi:hypothetical protein